jgi:hypothetical protein
MPEINILSEVKNRIGVTGTYHDNLLNGYIADVKGYMKDAGVSTSIIEGVDAVGVIAQGVKDLWVLGGGEVKFSPFFYERVTQLKYKLEPV